MIDNDYISRAGIIAEYDRQHQGPPGGARKIMETFPSADVRPVVLCRDCIYAPTGNQDGADLEWPCDDFPERNPCPLKCEDRWYSRKPAPDFFCANGKKLNT